MANMEREELIGRCRSILNTPSWDDNAVANAADAMADLLLEMTACADLRTREELIEALPPQPPPRKTRGEEVAEALLGLKYITADENAVHLVVHGDPGAHFSLWTLVHAAEALAAARKTVAKVIDEKLRPRIGPLVAVDERINAAVAAEREACAKMVESFPTLVGQLPKFVREQIADCIRGRSH